LAYNMNEKSSEGILVARGQLIISDEQPKFDRNRPAIPSTDEELRLNAFDPYSFVPSSSIRTVPFNFHSKCSPFVSHVSNIVNSLFLSGTCNIGCNTSHFTDISHHMSWSYINNNNFYFLSSQHIDTRDIVNSYSPNSAANISSQSAGAISQPADSNTFENNHVVSADTHNVESVANHAVDVDNQTVKSTAHVAHHAVDVDNQIVTSTAHVTHHNVDVDNQTVTSTAHITHHSVGVDDRVVTSTAHIDHHQVVTKEKLFTSVIEVPKFVFEINEKVVPLFTLSGNHSLLNTFSNNNFLGSRTNSLGTQTTSNSSGTSSVVSGAEEFTDAHSHSEHSDHSDDDNHGGSDDNPSSPVGDNVSIDWIVSELAGVKTKTDMKSLIDILQVANIDTSPFANVSDVDTPIILLMYQKDRWLGVGQFYCPCCDKTFPTCASLSFHLKSTHTTNNIPLEQAAFEYE
uniref:hypothetical protein n=1 Tax=Bacteroides acidifaciens TaxID=85831 RepID=UPI0025A5A65C